MVFEKIKNFFKKVAECFKNLSAWCKSSSKKPLGIKILCSLLAVTTLTATLALVSCKPDEEPIPEQTTYTVTFETNGGSAIDPVIVAEGTVLEKPNDPQLAGSEFVGWYADSTFKTPFYFDLNSAKITQNVTLYARWEVPMAAMEYVIDFNTGVEGLSYESVKTVNNKVFAGRLPVAIRIGYTFAGWAISMYDDAEKLSYMWEDGMTVAENMTFHALWVDNASEKLATPVVNVTASGLTWKAISGVSTYHVTVAGPVGFDAVATNTGSTTYSVDFTTAPIGEYEIIVTAVASDTTKSSEPAVRNYINKALARVSYFEVEGTTLSFTAVANATDYLLTVVCGDSNHNHTEMSLGGQTEYDFANCLTKSGKVSFAVTSYAEGYVSVTSRVYNYTKTLDTVTGLAVDEATGMLTWNAVDKAEKYVVSVDCGNVAHDHDKVVVGDTQFDMKECEAQEGGIKVSVYAVAATYGDSPSATYNYVKTKLATPGNVKMSGMTMSWNAVNGATGGYKVKIGDKTINVSTNSIDLSAQQITWVEANDYVIQIQAIGAGSAASLWSNDIDARYYAMYTSITYGEGYVTWNHVIGATSYSVKVNDGEVITVDGGENYAPITLTKAGENTISVCYTDGTKTSDWVSVTVQAYAVQFDTKVSTTTFATQYKAVGDPTDSFYSETVKKAGHTFYGWYIGEGVGAGNAELYEDLYFRTAESITLYADYTPNTYEITYDYGTGGVGASLTAMVTFGQHYQFAIPKPTGESVFEGWYTAPNGKGMPLTDEKGISIDPWSVAVDEVLNSNIVYAYWNDLVLDFSETKVSGSNTVVYSVSKGARINTVDHVTVPETYKGRPVKVIAAHAFLDCTKLKRISIPDTVEQIFTTGARSFDGCIALQEINITHVEGNNAIRYWSQDGILFDNGRLDEQDGTVEIAAFPMNYKSTTYRIPEGVTTIPNGAFEGSILQEISFSPDVTLVETRAFYNAKEVTKLTFEDPTEGEGKPLEIEPRAFEGCSVLEVINLPARISTLYTTRYEVTGEYITSGPAYEQISTSQSSTVSIEDSFYSCAKLKEINVAAGGSTYSSQDGVLFNANKTEIIYSPKYFAPKDGEYNVPQGVTKIHPGAFMYNYELKRISIPATVTTIGEYSFYGASGIQKITFGGNGFNDVTIEKYAFRNIYNISEIVFEQNSRITTIGEGAFMYNYRMTKLEIPATVKEIGDIAFRDWYYLTTVEFKPATTDSATLGFGDAPFYNSKIQTLNIPAHANELGGIFNGMNKLKTIVVDSENDYYTTESGILYDIDKTEMLYFPKEITGGYTLPATLKTIGAGIFKNNTKLPSFVVPNTVTTIGESAFEGSNIETITFEPGNDDNKLTIGANAFKNSDKLKTIVLPARTEKVGTYAFSYMDELTSLTLNEGLTEISEYMIYDLLKLTSLDIPASVKKIAWGGIYGNDNLANINFGENSQLEEIAGYGLAHNYAMESIEIPAGVKSLGYYSLYQNYGKTSGVLNSVTFAEGSVLERIEPYAFYYVKLKTIHIPKTVTEIAPYAFEYSTIETITFEKGGTENLTIGAPCEYRSSSSSDKLTTTYGYAFAYSKLKAIELPARLTEIGMYSFNSVSTLTSVTFEEGKNSSLQQIGNYAFRYCTGLTTVNIPKSVTNLPGRLVGSTKYNRTAIGHYAFADCPNLKTVNFEMEAEGYDPAKVRPMTFGIGVFNNCTSLEELNLPSRFVTYENDLSHEVFNPLGVRMTNNAGAVPEVFNGCTNLKEVNIIMDSQGNSFLAENELSSVDGAIYSIDGKNLIRVPVGRVESYEIPNTVEKIDAYALWNAEKLVGVTFQEGNDEVDLVIGERAFDSCISLTEISLAKRVSSIETKAFQGCVELATINLSTGLTTFDATVFDGCVKLAAVNAAPDSTQFSSWGGVLFNAATNEADLHTLYYYPASKQDTSYAVPASVKTIYRYAFYDNTMLEEVILPEGLQQIDDYAFYNATALKNIYIRKNVAMIGDYAFYNCTSLETLTFEEGGTVPLNIGNPEYVGLSNWYKSIYYGYVFGNCYMLENVTLPERTKVIADSAFAECRGLRTINLPENVEQLGSGAFRYCERLTSVDYDPAKVKFTAIPHRLFEYCYSLESFVVPETVIEFAIDTQYKQSLAFAYCTSLESIVFEEGCSIETFPRSVFAFCSSLKRIEIPATVTTFANGGSTSSTYGVFYNCEALEEIIFAETSVLETIGSYTFYGCKSLATIDIPETVSEISYGVFGKCESLDNVIIPENAYIDDSYSMFYNCLSLTNVTLPSTMSIIPSSFFSNCKSLTTFEIPENITEIYDYAFDGSGITAITLRPGIYYEYAAFQNMDSLVDVTIEEGVESLADEIFAYCDALETVVVPDSVINLGSYYTFAYCTSLKNVTLPQNDDLTYLPDSTFEGCTSLKSITIPQNYTEIGYYAFWLSGLESIVIPNSVESIWDEAFSECVNLTSVTFKDNVTFIGYGSFYGCTSLETFVYPDGCIIESVEDGTFRNCTMLSEIVLPETIARIGANAFEGCTSLTSINIPEMCTEVNFNAFYNCPALEEITIHEANEAFEVVDGIIMNEAQTEIILCTPAKTGSYTIPEGMNIREAAFMNSNLSEIILPANLTTIPKYWFSGISENTVVVIPEGVETIDQYAFAYSQIKSINIPASVTQIGNYAFYNSAIESITFTEGKNNLYIGSYAFENCTSLDNVVIPYRVRNATDLTSTVYSIGSSAFKGCTGLKTLTFEETPEENGTEGTLTIGSNAFENCTSLTKVDFPATFGDSSYKSGSSTYTIYALQTKAFFNCTSLQSVTFKPVEGRSISMYSQVFSGCTSLSEIELPSTLVYMGGGLLEGTAIESITIPASVTTMSTYSNYWYDEYGTYYSQSGGFYFKGCNNLKSVTFEAQVAKLPVRAFAGCPALETITFATETLTEIGDNAFDGCTSIASITIPDTVKTFGLNVFNGWTASQKVITNKTLKETNAWSVNWNKGCTATIEYLAA